MTVVAPKRVQRGLSLMQGGVPAEAYRAALWMPRQARSGTSGVTPATITSPSTPFTLDSGTSWQKTGITFDLSAVVGTVVAATWATTSDNLILSPPHQHVITGGGTHDVDFGAILGGSAQSISVAADANQIADINAAAGGTLTVILNLQTNLAGASAVLNLFTLSIS